MNKQELIDAVAAKAGLSKADAKRAVDALFDLIQESLKRGQRVSLAGFGTFEVRERAARIGRNPRTGKSVTIAAGKSPTLIASKRLRDAVAGGTDDPGPSITSKGKARP